MPRFFGVVGYVHTEETSPGVWEEIHTEREYFGDTLTITRRLESDKVNDDVVVSNSFSIVADPFAYEHFHAIRYVIWMGSKWKVTSVSVARPRLILAVGGLHND